MRTGALQEAAFYRAKLMAYESGSQSEVGRLERERLGHLEAQLQYLSSEKSSQERKMEELSDTLSLQLRLREHAEDRAADAMRRAEVAEESHELILREHSELHEKHLLTESSLRDHTDRVLSLSSLTQQREVEHDSLVAQIRELTASRDHHQRALDQAHAALDAASARTEEVEAQFSRARSRISELENAMMELRAELDMRTQEADTAIARLTDVENAWTKSREEADAYRALTTGGLGQLLDHQKELRTDEDRATRGHSEKIRAMELEASSLRKMLKEAGTRVDAAQNDVADQRRRVQSVEAEGMTLRTQLIGLRSQLAVALADSGRLRKDLAVKDSELRDKSRSASDAQVRLGMLRSYLADNGMVIDEDDMNQNGGQAPGSGGARLRDVENKLQQRIRQHEETELRLQSAIREKQDAQSQIQLLQSDIDRGRLARSPSSGEDSSSRVMAAERRLAESEASHREKMAQMEADYQTAVHYVK